VPDPIRPPTRSSAWSSPIPTSSAGWRKNFLKPSAPSEFNGNQSAGKVFLTSCRTYIRLCLESFEDDLTKVVWAMSYMKAGRAGRWANCEFEHEVKSGHLCFINWVDFEDEFQKDFMPLDSEAAAVNVLETTSYFQGRWSVDDYLDQFKDLIEDSGYSDPKTIVVKFRQGLDGPRQDDLQKTRGHGSQSLVPSCRPNGPEPCRGQSLPHLPPTIQPSDPRHKPYSNGLPTRSGCSCRTLCPLQPITRQSRPNGHRHDPEG